ncbi:hypothetical protein HGRIS_004295 [Hohenbuehelia grisea]|uniref:Uncharacterized protein n=1 Tax=Hohenbuehelia grisea TaxID=104357 RepID=A0ABR3IPC6_9AGAR
MSSLEWFWGMKHGSLNLDTRYNVFPISSSLLRLYEENKWGLLLSDDIMPEDSVLVSQAGLRETPHNPNSFAPLLTDLHYQASLSQDAAFVQDTESSPMTSRVPIAKSDPVANRTNPPARLNFPKSKSQTPTIIFPSFSYDFFPF